MKPKFSIIINTNNQERFIRCYNSILNQLYNNLEVVVVAENMTQEIMKKFELTRADQKHILFTTKFISNERILDNPGYMRNTGIVFSSSPYLIFCDDSVIFDEFALELLSNHIYNSQQVNDIITFSVNVENEFNVMERFDFPTQMNDIYSVKCKTFQPEIPHCSFVITKIHAESSPWTLDRINPFPTRDFLSNVMKSPTQISNINNVLATKYYVKEDHEKRMSDFIDTYLNTEVV